MIAGIAQAIPEMSGTTLRPLIPNFLMILSIRKTTRDIYPVSSNSEMNPNKMAI